jgi:hypothetical protein
MKVKRYMNIFDDYSRRIMTPGEKESTGVLLARDTAQPYGMGRLKILTRNTAI